MDQKTLVMYVGNKSVKWDNVNGLPDRKWQGPGSTLEVSSRVQAEKLLSHPDEFIDVTRLTEDELMKRAAKAQADSQERKRQARSATAQQAGGVLLQYATDEEIMAELKRRKNLETVRAESPKDADPTEKTGSSERTDEFINEKVSAALDTILESGNADDLDDNGVPTRAAVENIIGFSLTESEYAAALGGDAPTDPLDTTSDDE